MSTNYLNSIKNTTLIHHSVIIDYLIRSHYFVIKVLPKTKKNLFKSER